MFVCMKKTLDEIVQNLATMRFCLPSKLKLHMTREPLDYSLGKKSKRLALEFSLEKVQDTRPSHSCCLYLLFLETVTYENIGHSNKSISMSVP